MTSCLMLFHDLVCSKIIRQSWPTYCSDTTECAIVSIHTVAEKGVTLFWSTNIIRDVGRWTKILIPGLSDEVTINGSYSRPATGGSQLQTLNCSTCGQPSWAKSSNPIFPSCTAPSVVSQGTCAHQQSSHLSLALLRAWQHGLSRSRP